MQGCNCLFCFVFGGGGFRLCGAVLDFVDRRSYIKIWDLETKEEIGILKIENENENQENPKKKKKNAVLCTCLTWSHDGKTLFAGYTDKKIRVWTLISGDEYAN